MMLRFEPDHRAASVFGGLLLCSVLAAGVAAAGQPPSHQPRGPASPAQAPVAAAAASRERPAVVVRAVRLDRPLTIDGRLDEEAYRSNASYGDFIQQEPHEGSPASEKTDVWVFFDDRNIYVAARCWDSHPERDIVTELRRDNANTVQNESLTVVFDTFGDHRNGFFFQTGPLGVIRDQTIVDDVMNEYWNTVWDVKTGRFEGGWTAELAIPFKSLRYLGSGPQTWGINFRRIVKWKNEFSYITPLPASFGSNAIARMGFAATLAGLETPSQSRNLELKPYAVTSVTSDRTAIVPFSNDLKGTGGFDFKYGLTRSLIADVTVNTDFAQVEEDLQQVNLTRFSLFFPEKRDFFLEGQGIFAFGGVAFSNGVNDPGDVPILFFSRRIGLSQSQDVPVIAGGRLTGRADRYTIGALNIQTDDKASAGAVSTNFTAVRVKRDFLRRSNIGFIATRRSPTAGVRSGGSNLVLGADTNLFLFRNVAANFYYARADTPALTGGADSYRGRFEYAGDRYGMVAEHLLIGEHFNPEVGYVRRNDFRKNFAQARFSPRPKRNDRVRKLTFQGSIARVTDAGRTVLLNRDAAGRFAIDFQNSDQVSVDYVGSYEWLPVPFAIAPRVVVPTGGYDYNTTTLAYTLGQQHKVSGKVSVAVGSFYDGTRRLVGYAGRIGIVPKVAVEPSISLNWVDLPYGAFSARIVSSRFILTPSPRMAVSSLVQFNATAHTVSSSVRLRWEYLGGSELFVVYSDGRDTLSAGFPSVLNRSFAVKATRLLRF
jgi:hypothetical protein